MNQKDVEQPYFYKVPDYFPVLKYPADNTPTVSKFELGRKLFYDKLLSKDFTVSCASCHSQHLAFSDSVALSVGAFGKHGLRNAPQLVNIAYTNNFFWDGGVPSLEFQALAPLDNPLEMNLPYDSLLARLNNNNEYKLLFQKAFGKEADLSAYTKAIACFERAIISGNSRFDQYYYRHNAAALSTSEKNGYLLFSSARLSCNNCHAGFNFSNGGFENNGIYMNYTDQGRYKVTTHVQDIGKFKVPSLRNVAITAPYMHDGSFMVLDSVIEHYNRGGRHHFNQSALVKPLNLSPQEKIDLINFLKSLTDIEVLNNKELMPH